MKRNDFVCPPQAVLYLHKVLTWEVVVNDNFNIEA